MSLISRLLGKTPPDPTTPAASKPDAPADSPPRPDPVARAQEEETSLAQAIAAGDMIAVGQWVLEGSSTGIRQRAAQAIEDPDQLRELIRATRHGNDKNVHRILTGKRDERLAEVRRTQKLQSDLDTAAADIAQLSARPYDALYGDSLRQLEARWRSVESHATPDLQGEVARQLDAARQVVERHRQEIEAEAERRRSAALATEEARHKRQVAAQAAADSAAEQARLVEAKRLAERQAERQAEEAKRAADEEAVRDLVGLLRQAQAALDHGGTARAARLREAIAEKLPNAPALPAWFAGKLHQIDARIEELRDWKTFTVVPKRAAMVQRMQGLIGADLSPEELAQQIRRLRDEWRTLNRGAGEDPSPEWQQFDEAANRAYEPCREHFAKQAELRRANQAHREALLARLATFVAEQAGEDPNWRVIQQALTESRREWRQYAPVDQAVVTSLQDRFHALTKDLQARLDAEYARNIETKRELIASAAKLLELADTRQAIEESKSLQRAWKTVGLVPRHQDNALWEEFRKHCDAVFGRSAQESAAYAAALDANQSRAVALCESLEQFGEIRGESGLSRSSPLEELRAEFESLELPRASARELRQRFSRAAERHAEAVRSHRAAAARRGWTDLLAAAGHVRAYALAIARGGSPADCEALRMVAESAIAGLANAPKGTPALLQEHVARIAAGTLATDLAANEAALRLLCVRAELIAGIESPDDDLPLRREYQMQRLVASMSRGERVAPADIDDLALEWIAAGPVEAEVYDFLLGRFMRCREACGR